MRLFKQPAARTGSAILLAGTLALTLGACGDSNGNFVPGGDNDNANFRSLDDVVLAQCNQRPENTQPVSLDGLQFNDQTPEDTRPEDSLVTQTCI